MIRTADECLYTSKLAGAIAVRAVEIRGSHGGALVPLAARGAGGASDQPTLRSSALTAASFFRASFSATSPLMAGTACARRVLQAGGGLLNSDGVNVGAGAFQAWARLRTVS
jgi:hypothetical protein